MKMFRSQNMGMVIWGGWGVQRAKEGQEGTKENAADITEGIVGEPRGPEHNGCAVLVPNHPRTLRAPGSGWSRRRRAMRSGCWTRSGGWSAWSTWLRSSGRRHPRMKPGRTVSPWGTVGLLENRGWVVDRAMHVCSDHCPWCLWPCRQLSSPLSGLLSQVLGHFRRWVWGISWQSSC